MKTKSRRTKPKMTQPVVPYKKKLRTNLPRRRRTQISPVLYSSLNSIVTDKTSNSSSISYFVGEVSCDSSRVSVGSDRVKGKPRSSARKREFGEIKGLETGEFRRVTRSFFRQQEKEKESERKGVGGGDVEVSESSCVESCSGADLGERILKSKGRSGEGVDNVKDIGGNEKSEVITRSDGSRVQQYSPESARKFSEFSRKVLMCGGKGVEGTENLPEFKGIELVSITSGVDSPSEVKLQNFCSSVGDLLSDKTIKDGENRGLEAEFPEVSRNYIDQNFTVSNSESTTEQKPKLFGLDSDLACTEQLSYEDVSDYSSSHKNSFSELKWEVFQENSDTRFLRLFSIHLLRFWKRIFREIDRRFNSVSYLFIVPSVQSGVLQINFSSRYLQSLFRFEDEEDEESYKMFRSRERRQVYLRDYAEEYCSTTEYGDLVIQQRLQMVHWIVEQSSTKELQKETLFLGVSFLDRFLSRGFFKSKRNLQIVGIACLTLATRIEENQPLNSVRQNTFYVGSNVYSRCEVVAMEWLVQDVLNFQCFLPTIYNFLWFYLKAARANTEMEKTVKYLAVLALLGHEQLCYWPSTVAAGLVILASLAAKQNASYQRVMETHVRTKNDDLSECIKV
ncbi:hypothetical protein L1049_006872 [Liquidambar formosana]|uniref:Cyclin-like domain-containing protein n=1 Tax=Liquidambar formosana TaxID=63359 RepID=A0AAP0WUA2_LIQFO